MRSTNLLIFILCVVSILEGCLFAEAFRSLSTKQRLSGLPSKIRSTRRKSETCRKTSLFAAENDDEEKIAKKGADTIVDPADVEDLPMFSLEYNSDNVDYSQLSVPPFTSALIFFVSIGFTAYLYYVGITGGVATMPPDS